MIAQTEIASGTHCLQEISSISFYRELTFDDLKLGEFVGHGVINIESQVDLPESWYMQHNINRRQKYVIKMAAGNGWYTDQGDRECDIFEALASNRTLAMEHNITSRLFVENRSQPISKRIQTHSRILS
jgi:hypothetical protein